jgi:hypothetical protein
MLYLVCSFFLHNYPCIYFDSKSHNCQNYCIYWHSWLCLEMALPLYIERTAGVSCSLKESIDGREIIVCGKMFHCTIVCGKKWPFVCIFLCCYMPKCLLVWFSSSAVSWDFCYIHTFDFTLFHFHEIYVNIFVNTHACNST